MPCSDRLPTQKTKKGRVLYCSDCSGLDGGALALRSLTKHVHLFGSEINPDYREIFQMVHPGVKVFPDVCGRNHSAELLPLTRKLLVSDILIYSAGFPCQPYSRQGRRGGEHDTRSMPIWDILKSVNVMLPDVVLLENVAALARDKCFKTQFDLIIQVLQKVNGGCYNVSHTIMDSWTHGMVPAQRERLYIVCVRKDKQVASWDWPGPVSAPSLETILDKDGPKSDLKCLNNTGLRNIKSATRLKTSSAPFRLLLNRLLLLF